MRTAAIGLVFAAAMATAACETYADERYGGGYGGYDYVGRDYQRLGNDCGFFDGPGAEMLDPWLACTEEGQGIVRRGFGVRGDRRVSAEAADRANIWFRRHADTDRDLCLTDAEVRAALVNAERFAQREGY